MQSDHRTEDNIDLKTVESFGDEWARYDQVELSHAERKEIFHAYFSIFPWSMLPASAEGFDMGCGSGRWASLVAPRVGRLHCIDPSPEALSVAQRALALQDNVILHNESVQTISIAPESQDFGYSLGVLHHVPDTESALRACSRLLKPGAPFLVYLYYRFDNRPWWFRAIWKISDMIRRAISRMPKGSKNACTDSIALLVYWPLARLAKVLGMVGVNASGLPLYFYRNSSFYTMRTDSRDRFGTPLEQRFTRQEIFSMMKNCGFTDVTFSDREPYWCAIGYKAR